jgi:hypothetical protein
MPLAIVYPILPPMIPLRPRNGVLLNEFYTFWEIRCYWRQRLLDDGHSPWDADPDPSTVDKSAGFVSPAFKVRTLGQRVWNGGPWNFVWRNVGICWGIHAYDNPMISRTMRIPEMTEMFNECALAIDRRVAAHPPTIDTTNRQIKPVSTFRSQLVQNQ